MDIKTAFLTCVKDKYATFKGRASRSEYWWFVLCNVILAVFLTLVTEVAPDLGAILTLVVGLGLLLPGIAVTVRRLHDINKSGWFALLGCIPLLCIILIVFMCMKGTDGPNKYSI